MRERGGICKRLPSAPAREPDRPIPREPRVSDPKPGRSAGRLFPKVPGRKWPESGGTPSRAESREPTDRLEDGRFQRQQRARQTPPPSSLRTRPATGRWQAGEPRPIARYGRPGGQSTTPHHIHQASAATRFREPPPQGSPVSEALQGVARREENRKFPKRRRLISRIWQMTN